MIAAGTVLKVITAEHTIRPDTDCQSVKKNKNKKNNLLSLYLLTVPLISLTYFKVTTASKNQM